MIVGYSFWICSLLIFLIAVGINVNDHDIRFVEDNWESPVRLCIIFFTYLVYYR